MIRSITRPVTSPVARAVNANARNHWRGPSLILDYVADKYSMGAPGIYPADRQFEELHTMTRASSAWCYGPDKVYKEVAANLPRLDHDPVTGAPLGILVEESRTNLLTYSSEFANAAWSKEGATITPAAETGPDGLASAALLQESTAGGLHNTYRNTISVTAGAPYSATIFAKPASGSRVLRLAALGYPVNVDLMTLEYNAFGATSFTVSVSRVSNGFVRVSLNGVVAPTSTGTFYISLAQAITTASNNYTGDGTSGLYIWGAQLEQGSFPTSHIPTPAVFQSRASTATYIDSTGTLQTASTNVARDQAYGWDENGVLRKIGLLVEGQATNFVLNSYFSLGTEGATPTEWIERGLVTGRKTADSSAFGGYVMRVTGTGGSASTTDDVRVSVSNLVAGTVYTVTVRVKPISGSGSVLFAGASKAIPSSGGWQAITIQVTASGTSHAIFFGANGQFDIDWVQVETGPVATSYIPTTTAQVTRAADITTSSQVTRAADGVSVENLAPWYRTAEGTIVAEADKLTGNATASHIFSFTTNTVSTYEGIRAFHQNPYAKVFFRDADGPDKFVTLNSQLDRSKLAISYESGNSIRMSADGSAVSPASISGESTAAISRLYIGSRNGGELFRNGHIRSIRYYPRRLSDAELQALTTP